MDLSVGTVLWEPSDCSGPVTSSKNQLEDTKIVFFATQLLSGLIFFLNPLKNQLSIPLVGVSNQLSIPLIMSLTHSGPAALSRVNQLLSRQIEVDSVPLDAESL